jgi:hypothetical protein
MVERCLPKTSAISAQDFFCAKRRRMNSRSARVICVYRDFTNHKAYEAAACVVREDQGVRYVPLVYYV